MASEWFYTRDGKGKVGPVSSGQLQALAKSGQLQPTDMVWKEGMAQWTPATKIKGLFPSAENKPVIPPSSDGKEQSQSPRPHHQVEATGATPSTLPAKQAMAWYKNKLVLGAVGGLVLGLLVMVTLVVIIIIWNLRGEPSAHPSKDGNGIAQTPDKGGNNNVGATPKDTNNTQKKDEAWITVVAGKPETFEVSESVVAVSDDGSAYADSEMKGDAFHAIGYVNRKAGLSELYSSFDEKRGFRAFALSPDGTRLAFDDRSGIVIRHTATNKQICRINVTEVVRVVFSPDSKRLLDYGGNVWDAQTGQRLLNIEPRIIGTALAFSADGTRLAGVVVSAIAKEEPFVPTKYRHDLKVWDALNGKEIFTFRVIQKISSIAMSPDGKLIALFSPSDCRLTVRSSQDGQELFSVSASRNHSYSGMGLVASERHVAFSADGKLVAAPGYEGDSRGFKLWDARTGQEVAFKRLPYQVTFLAFTPDGERLISAGQDTFGLKKGFVTVWHRNSNRIDAPSHFTNSIGMKFAWIPAGQFLMGSPNEEKGRDKSEIQHKVTLTKGFYLGVHTVTQEQWQAVMANNPSQFKGQKNLPVERVSWNDCQEFIKKLRAIDNKPYRLPTEAEWEYACRARGTTPFYAGDSLTTDQANFDSFWEKTTPVGSFPPNAFGLFDMHGNVIQWCQDWHGEYSQDEVVDPQGPNTGTSRVWRGSLYFNNRDMCRSAYRGADVPQSREFPYGLRVCFFRD